MKRSFAALAIVLIALLSSDLRPASPYPATKVEPPCAVTRTRQISFDWSPERPPSELVVPVEIEHGHKLDVRVSDAADDRALVSVSLDRSDLVAARVAAIALPRPSAARLRVRFSSDAESASVAPSVAWTMPAPRDAVVRVGGARVSIGGPSMLVEYPWPSRFTLGLWVAGASPS